MPDRRRFKSAHGWDSTLGHELVHWTGHGDHLARDLTGRFRTRAYSAEELVAELGSAFLLTRLGLRAEPHPQHAAYVAHWIELLRSDAKAIFTAASKARQAVDYLLREPGV